MEPTREEALRLMEEWTPSESLRKHMLAVEAAVTAYADKYGEPRGPWAVAALLHDFDYERYPKVGVDGHPFVGVRELESRGYPRLILDAILGHAGEVTGVKRETLLAKALFACDELTGLITAAVLVRPDKDIAGLGLSSLKKKLKDKAFARGVNRDDVRQGATELGIDLDEHMQFVLSAMQARAAELGLDGSLAG
ncbi:MAG TPA: HDIG domain-containing protein [Trueperaceae bacterium]|jgi:putative nucleotidyltransferase with HDIG domain|nr:HDIG domain-containing protein [Trueperaceae bacterium]